MTTVWPRGALKQVLVVAIPVVIALVAACSSGDDDTAAKASDRTTTTAKPEDFVMQAKDFTNIHDMTPLRGFFITNKLGHLKEALKVANDRDGGEAYPVGTLIQLVPQEAMIKRAPGFDPASKDWEFFFLDVTPQGTKIVTRGGAEVKNRFGGSCSGCHSAAKPAFDFVCEHDHGCAPLPIGDDVIKSVQNADPRPRLHA
jgi:hypothetical protein